MSAMHSRRLATAVVALGLLLALGGCLGAIQTPGSQAHPSPEIRFQEVTNESGLHYTDVVGSQVGVGNASVYAADVDRDGWTDLLTSGGHQPALWHNENGTFAEASSFPSIEAPIKSATFVDFDDDGWEDLLLFPEYGDAVALRNDHGTFERTSVGLGNYTYPLGASAADYDGDGDEDLFVYQSGDWANGKPKGYVYTESAIKNDNGNPNFLYENVGGEFERVENAGLSGTRWSLAASFADLNGDGRPDVYVANDYNSDILYLNRGSGQFDQRIIGGNTSRNGMATEISDFNGDARPDMFVTNIEIPISRQSVGKERYQAYRRLFSYVVHSGRTQGNTLLINQGNGTFNESAASYDVKTGGWGWAASHVDLNNDGQRDLFHATQNVVNVHLEDPVYTYPMVFERTGENFTRLDASDVGFQEDDGRGMVTLDYDRDGDMDVVSANYVARFAVYENTMNRSNVNAIEFLAVERDGSAALGATVRVEAGYASRTIHQNSRTDYLSQDPRLSHVGLGTQQSATLTVTWPDGTKKTFEDVPAGQYVHLHKNGTVETVVEFDG